jgi:hypothetical protein
VVDREPAVAALLLVARQAVVTFQAGDRGAAVSGELFGCGMLGPLQQIVLAGEELGLDRIVDLDGGVGEGIGVLGSEPAGRQGVCELGGVGQGFGAALPATSFGSRQTLMAGDHIAGVGADTLGVQLVDA